MKRTCRCVHVCVFVSERGGVRECACVLCIVLLRVSSHCVILYTCSNGVEGLLHFMQTYAQQPQVVHEAVSALRLLLQDQHKVLHVRVGKKDHTHKFAKKGSQECFVVEEVPGVYVCDKCGCRKNAGT